MCPKIATKFLSQLHQMLTDFKNFVTDMLANEFASCHPTWNTVMQFVKYSPLLNTNIFVRSLMFTIAKLLISGLVRELTDVVRIECTVL